MSKNRLEAFSDGVLAIIITIMVLELKVPHGATLTDLQPLIPIFLSYVLSFATIAIYWGNHHHLLHTISYVNTKILWANIHLLFWLSLFPFATAWMGENNFARETVAVYGGLSSVCGLAYFLLQQTILKTHKLNNRLLKAVKQQSKKGITSECFYLISIPIAFVYPVISALLIAAIAVVWIVPDQNIEEALRQENT